MIPWTNTCLYVLHVLYVHSTLPGTMNTKHHIRPRLHNFKLTAKNSSITECDFITRMLLKTFIDIVFFSLLFYVFTLLFNMYRHLFAVISSRLTSCNQVAVCQPLLKSYLIWFDWLICLEHKTGSWSVHLFSQVYTRVANKNRGDISVSKAAYIAVTLRCALIVMVAMRNTETLAGSLRD